jgi:hypothetical protein
VFVTSPVRAVKIALMAHREIPFAVLPSPALAANDLIAIAASGLASAVDEVPAVEVARQATVNMDDAPAPIVNSAGAAAAPVRSLWQTATTGIKLRFHASWALRDARALAWLTTTGW